MFLSRLNHMVAVSAILFGGLLSGAVAHADEDKVLSDSILPRETYLYFSVPSVSGMKDAWGSSSFGRMLSDAAFDEIKAEFQEAFSSEAAEGVAVVQDAIGLTLEELLDIPAGEITLAISKAGNRMGVVIFVDYGSHESQVAGLLGKASGALARVGELEQGNLEHGGTEIVLYNVKAEIAKKTPLAREFGWFLKDERLVISNSSALLKLAVDNWAGSSERTLATNSVYSYIMEQCQSEEGSSLMTTYFDPVGLFTQLVQTGSLGEAGLPAGMAISVFPMLGVNQLKAIGSVGEMGVDGFEGVSRSFIYTEQPPQGAMQIFQLSAVDQTPPSWVKENVSAWMSTNWKVGEAYTAVETLVDMFQGAGAFARLIDQAATRPPRVHIKNDVIDQLDGKLNLVVAPSDSRSAGATDDVLFALGVRDNQKMADLLSKLTSEPGFPGEVRELNGATIYEINPGNGVSVMFTVANGQLLLGVGGTQLEQAVRNTSDVRPLAETDEFRAVAEHYADGALLVGFSRPAEGYRRLYDMLRSGNGADNFPGIDEVFERIDFTKLPPFEAVEKYMAPTGAYWMGDENGVFMEQFSLAIEE